MEGNDPPDLTNQANNSELNNDSHVLDNNLNNINDKRPRDSDDDLSDVERLNNERAKMTKSLLDKVQSNVSSALLRQSILNRNPFALLDPDAQDDLAGKESSKMNNKQFANENPPKKAHIRQRIPPIIITKPFENPKDAISLIQATMNGKVAFKILREGYNVTLESINDHNTLKEFLAKQKIPFYTYTSADKKPLRLVLKGVHHSYTPEDIIVDLSAKKITALSVQPMFGKGKVCMDMFIVNFEHGTKVSELTKTVKFVCHQIVSWHSYIKKDVGTQCRKCQRFGHAATNCGLEYRCVKCPHRHAPGDCPLEDDQAATCVNCNSAHPASYKKCPVYTKYAENLKKNQGKTGKNKSNPKKANTVNFSSKSSTVNNNQSYSQVLKANIENKDNNLNFMSKEINNLFNCSLTELLQKIQHFIPEYKKVNDLMLKKIMIIDFLSQFT
jgi:hypothetical protein